MRPSSFLIHRFDRLSKAALIALTAVLVIAGCASNPGSGSGGTSSPSPASKTTVEISMGDAPADWMLAFAMNISSMTAHGNAGDYTVVSSGMPMEMMHLMGTMQPIAMFSATQGVYTGASITCSSATVTYLEPMTKAITQKTFTGPFSANVTFPASITIGSTPMALGFDLDLAHSVTADSKGNLTFSPVFHVTSGMQGAGNAMDFVQGGIHGMMGVISTVSGASFTMTSMQAAQSFTFMTNSSTQFSGGGSMGSMSNGTMVMVDATLQADGSLMATRVLTMMNGGGVMSGGIITAVTGHPATALTLVMQNGVGMGMMGSYFADGITVNLTSNPTYTIDQDGIDLSGLDFTPSFDSDHVYVGQSVMPVGSGSMMSGGMGGGMMGGSSSASMTASGVYLEPQGLSGTTSAAIAPGATTKIVVALPSDSAFTALNGATSVTVFQQTETTVAGGATIASGTSVHVYGLLFNDNGQWKMVASRIGAN